MPIGESFLPRIDLLLWLTCDTIPYHIFSHGRVISMLGTAVGDELTYVSDILELPVWTWHPAHEAICS